MEDKLIEAAMKLLAAMDKHAETTLGREIADVIKYHSIGVACASFLIELIVAFNGEPCFLSTLVLLVGIVILWSMYYRINAKLDIPFGQNIVKSVVTGFCTNLVAYFIRIPVDAILASEYVSLLIAVIAFLFVGYAVTWGSGFAYLKVLTYWAQQNKNNPNSDSEEK